MKKILEKAKIFLMSPKNYPCKKNNTWIDSFKWYSPHRVKKTLEYF